MIEPIPEVTGGPKSVCLNSYSVAQPLLLLTDFPPETAGGGAVILKSLLNPEDLKKIIWLTPSRPRGEAHNIIWLRRGSAARKPNLGRSLWLDSTLMAGDLVEEILQIAHARNVRGIWIVMHGAGVAIASRLLRRANLPVHLTVHDDPAFGIALASKRYLGLVPLIERDFSQAIRKAVSIDVICSGMAERYLRRYGVNSVVVHRGMNQVVEPSPPYDKTRWGLRIGVLGNTYGRRQLLILCRSIAQAAQELGTSGRLLIVGGGHAEKLRKRLAGQIEVEFTGHIEESEAVDKLKNCFFLYLNYPFSAVHKVRRETSFPTKLSTYVQAARPILIHAPVDSSLAALYAVAGFTYRWDTPRVSQGVSVLKRAWSDPQLAESCHTLADSVRVRYFDLEPNRRVLFDALNRLAAQ